MSEIGDLYDRAMAGVEAPTTVDGIKTLLSHVIQSGLNPQTSSLPADCVVSTSVVEAEVKGSKVVLTARVEVEGAIRVTAIDRLREAIGDRVCYQCARNPDEEFDDFFDGLVCPRCKRVFHREPNHSWWSEPTSIDRLRGAL